MLYKQNYSISFTQVCTFQSWNDVRLCLIRLSTIDTDGHVDVDVVRLQLNVCCDVADI